jgi:hypothetical protein
MKLFKNILLVLAVLISFNIYADSLKVIIDYEFSDKSLVNKMAIKLYKDGDLYKLVRKLSNSPGETGVVTTYIDVTGNSVVTVTEKDGVKKGIKSGWSDDYSALVMQYHVLFRGIPSGKSFKNFSKSAGSETVSGKECDVYEVGISLLGAVTKYYMWNSIMLRSTAPDYSVNATGIDENPLFAADELTVPGDVEWNIR